MEIAIMLEGQMGLNWPRLQKIARAVEDLGYAGLYRSDHFINPSPPDLDSLEMWISLAWLASHTSRIDIGVLVTPFSTRHPVFTARMGIQVDQLSNGRLQLGIGAGWQDREHEMFGFNLLEPKERFDRFAEGTEVVYRLIHEDEPVSFNGRYYQLKNAQLLPRPLTGSHPKIIIGGTGRNRTLPLAARYADEWNAVFISRNEFIELNALLDELLRAEGREVSEVRRTLMTNVTFGKDEAALKARLEGRDPQELLREGVIVGDGAAVSDQLASLAESGVQRVMLQWLDLDDLVGLEDLARAVL